MTSVNKVILVGNLGGDPEMFLTQAEELIARFSVATSETWRDSTGGIRESTEWHRVVAYGEIADAARRLLRKGAPVYLEGVLRTRKWADDSGSTRYTTEVRVAELRSLAYATKPKKDKERHERRLSAHPARNFSGEPKLGARSYEFDDTLPY